MITITIAITDDKNIVVKTDQQTNVETKKIGRPKKATTKSKSTTKSKKPAAKKFQRLPEPMDVDFETSDDEDDSVPFEVF